MTWSQGHRGCGRDYNTSTTTSAVREERGRTGNAAGPPRLTRETNDDVIGRHSHTLYISFPAKVPTHVLQKTRALRRAVKEMLAGDRPLFELLGESKFYIRETLSPQDLKSRPYDTQRAVLCSHVSVGEPCTHESIMSIDQ